MLSDFVERHKASLPVVMEAEILIQTNYIDFPIPAPKSQQERLRLAGPPGLVYDDLVVTTKYNSDEDALWFTAWASHADTNFRIDLAADLSEYDAKTKQEIIDYDFSQEGS